MGTANKGNQSFEILGIGDLGGATAWIQREKEGDKTKLACFTRANASEGIGRQNQHNKYMLVREGFAHRVGWCVCVWWRWYGISSPRMGRQAMVVFGNA